MDNSTYMVAAVFIVLVEFSLLFFVVGALSGRFDKKRRAKPFRAAILHDHHQSHLSS